MRKPVFAICEQQRRRSAHASAQSDQHLCCSLPRWYNISSFYILNFKRLASFCSCTGWFVSYLVANPEDRFSRERANFILGNKGIIKTNNLQTKPHWQKRLLDALVHKLSIMLHPVTVKLLKIKSVTQRRARL